jgi:hypothetical protein
MICNPASISLGAEKLCLFPVRLFAWLFTVFYLLVTRRQPVQPCSPSLSLDCLLCFSASVCFCACSCVLGTFCVPICVCVFLCLPFFVRVLLWACSSVCAFMSVLSLGVHEVCSSAVCRPFGLSLAHSKAGSFLCRHPGHHTLHCVGPLREFPPQTWVVLLFIPFSRWVNKQGDLTVGGGTGRDGDELPLPTHAVWETGAIRRTSLECEGGSTACS